MYDLKIIIIGAGIGGLTAGIALRQAGYEIEVYDKAKELRPAGAGISLWSNGVKVLNYLGLGEEIARIGGRMDRMEYRSHTDKLLNRIDLTPLVEKVGQRPYPVARTDLQNLLLGAFGREDVHLNSRCIGVEQSDRKATAIFEGDRKATGDLVIGADGIHSLVRRYVTGQEIALRYADYINWNGLVKANPDFTSKNNWAIYVGEGKRASMMPVGGDRFYFFFGCPTIEGTEVAPENRQEELEQRFQGWATPVQKLIQNLDPQQTNRLEIHDIDPLDRFVRGRVALLGDSAHATTPTLGQGGCQAMEDAEILSRYLLTTNIGVEDALKRYETARKERTANLVLKARKRTDTIYGKEQEMTQQWYEQLRQENPEDVVNALAKIILSGPFN